MKTTDLGKKSKEETYLSAYDTEGIFMLKENVKHQ